MTCTEVEILAALLHGYAPRYTHVEFSDTAQATAALALHGASLLGTTVTARYATPYTPTVKTKRVNEVRVSKKKAKLAAKVAAKAAAGKGRGGGGGGSPRGEGWCAGERVIVTLRLPVRSPV